MSQKARDAVQGSQQGPSNVDTKQQDRSYNPVNEAGRGSVSDKLNTDAARYKKGPGPV